MENQQTSEAGAKERIMTPEEIRQKQAELIKDYREQIKYLKVQAEYEELLTSIEESKYRRYRAIASTAQLFEHMEREEEAMKEYVAAQAEAERRAAENAAGNATPEEEIGLHFQSQEQEQAPVRKPRKLATE